MNPVSTPLEMSAAGIRLAGYMIESNLRIAQALGEAALKASPFAMPADLRKQVAQPATPKTKAMTPVKKSATAKPKPVAAKKVKAVATPKAKPANSKPASGVAAAPALAKKPAAPAKTATKVDAQPKLAREASPKPAVSKPASPKAEVAPTFKSRAVRPAPAPKTPVKEATKTTSAAKKPAPVAKADAPKPVVAEKVETSAKPAVSKAHRAPSTPPAMPKRDTGPGKD